MTVTEYITSTLIDTFPSCLSIFTQLYKPSFSNRDQDKPLILLLHGAGGDHHHFDDMYPILIENGYYAMVCDLRYHGRSQPNDHLDEAVFDFTSIIQDLDRVLSWFQKQHALSKLSVALGGISMGGMVAQAYAHHLLSTNDRVKIHALVGIGCAHIQIKVPTIPWMALYKAASYRDIQAMIPVARQSIIDSANTDIGKARSASSLCLVDDRVLFHCLQACANAQASSDHDLFVIPQLLIRGQLDLHTKDVMEAWYSNAQKANSKSTVYKVIPGAGHLATVDKGRLIGDHIVAFLSTQ